MDLGEGFKFEMGRREEESTGPDEHFPPELEWNPRVLHLLILLLLEKISVMMSSGKTSHPPLYRFMCKIMTYSSY